MSLQMKKETLLSILFTICVGLPYLNIYEVTFAVWTLVILLTIKRRYSLNFLHYLGYFLTILVLAFLVGVLKEASVKTYNFLKDITYLSKPFLGLLAGYQLCRDHIKNPFRIVVYTAAFIAIAHMLVIMHAFLVYRVTNIHDLRLYGGYFSDFEIYALIILIFNKQFRLEFSTKQVLYFFALIGLSSLLYLARTNFIQFVILYIGMKGFLVLNKRSLTVMGILIGVVLLAYAAIYTSNPRRGAKGLEAFFYKIKIAPMEPFKTKVNRDDWVDFNDNYRSYENILTIQQVSNKGTAAVIFGEGLGSTIDLKREVWLQTSSMRYIPFLHNGFMTVFLKTGLLGLSIYLCTILFFFRQRKSSDPLIRSINLLFIGTGVFLIVSNWVFLGFYNLFDTKTLLIGFLLAYKERLHKLQAL